MGDTIGPEIMSTTKAHVVFVNSDLTEGRGNQVPKHICHSPSTAKRLASKAGVQGSDAPVYEMDIYRIEGWWFGPVCVVSPTDKDLKEDERIKKEITRSQEFEAAVKEAKELGLSKESLVALLNGSAL